MAFTYFELTINAGDRAILPELGRAVLDEPALLRAVTARVVEQFKHRVMLHLFELVWVDIRKSCLCFVHQQYSRLHRATLLLPQARRVRLAAALLHAYSTTGWTTAARLLAELRHLVHGI